MFNRQLKFETVFDRLLTQSNLHDNNDMGNHTGPQGVPCFLGHVWVEHGYESECNRPEGDYTQQCTIHHVLSWIGGIWIQDGLITISVGRYLSEPTSPTGLLNRC